MSASTINDSPSSEAPSPQPRARAPWEADPDCGMRLDRSQDPDPLRTSLLVTFGGVWATGAQPGFEFVSTAADLPGSALFLTDIDQVWYQSGVRGVGSSIPEVAAFLRGVIDDNGFDRIVMIGNSAGGYAALLFGALVGADVVHAFSPQTELVNPQTGTSCRSSKQPVVPVRTKRCSIFAALSPNAFRIPVASTRRSTCTILVTAARTFTTRIEWAVSPAFVSCPITTSPTAWPQRSAMPGC